MKLARGLCKFIALIILLVVFLCPAHAEEVLLLEQQNLTLGNCTIEIEGADSQAGLVWLCILADHETPLSVVFVVGEAFRFGELTLRILRIYAGDSADLVVLEIRNKKMQ
jgi:hypothetical protein